MTQLSVVVPAYNEVNRLPQFLNTLIPVLKRDFENNFEIIVVDDGSFDGTSEMATKLLGSYGRVFTFSKNKGKGAAIIAGIGLCKGEFICVTDADGSAGYDSYRNAYQFLQTSGATGVIGIRYGEEKNPEVLISLKRKVLGSVFAAVTRFVLGLNYKDTQCGFKMYKSLYAKTIFGMCKIMRFGIDFEALYIAKKLGITFEEMNISWTEMAGSKVNLWRDGLRMFSEMWRVRSMHSKHQFVTHGNQPLEVLVESTATKVDAQDVLKNKMAQ